MRVKIGQKLTLYHYSRDNVLEGKYVATVTKITGIAILVKYRNKHGTWSRWLNKKLEMNVYPWGRYKAIRKGT